VHHRRSEGQDLPPPPKTAIAGPEYFGLTHPDVLRQIEALDPERLCTDYWAGKEVCNILFVQKRVRKELASAIPLPRGQLVVSWCIVAC
jgi:hypothetical protein